MTRDENTEVRVYRFTVIKTAFFNYIYQLSRQFHPYNGSTIPIIYHESHYPNSPLFIHKLKSHWMVPSVTGPSD